MRITAELAKGLMACQKHMLKGIFCKKTYELSPSSSCTVQSVRKMSKSWTSSRVRLSYLNIWICMRFQISKHFFLFAFQIHTCCLYSCPTLCMYLTTNSSQKLFIFYLVIIFYHQAQRALRLVWSWLFFLEISFMNKGTRERPNNPVRHRQCLKPIKVVFSPGTVSLSHSHCLVLFWSQLSPQQLFGWSVILLQKVTHE